MYKKKSLFVTFEGIEGSGKSYQSQKLYKNLKRNNISVGLIVGTIYLLFFLTFTNNKKRSVKLMMLIAVPGYLFDSLLVLLSAYNFECFWKLGVLPIWLEILWLSFATLFVDVLVFFKRYPIIGILISATLGPFTYYLGQPIGIIVINNYYFFFISMMLFWALLMHYYLKYILQFNFTE